MVSLSTCRIYTLVAFVLLFGASIWVLSVYSNNAEPKSLNNDPSIKTQVDNAIIQVPNVPEKAPQVIEIKQQRVAEPTKILKENTNPPLVPTPQKLEINPWNVPNQLQPMTPIPTLQDLAVPPQVGQLPPNKPTTPLPAVQDNLVVPPPQIFNNDDLSQFRASEVRKEFLHAWNSYKTFAWGKDELKPVSSSAHTWLDMGLTIVDSLDTLWIMELYDDFSEARNWVASTLNFDVDKDVPFFEITIRELGGLLSAYELSKDAMFLEKAENLGKRLLRGFSGSIPLSTVNLRTGSAHPAGWTGGNCILSEIGTIQLEFLYLAYHTGNTDFAKKALSTYAHLDSLAKPKKVYPLLIKPHTGTFYSTNDFSVGGLGDSFYEYLLKLWLLTNKQADGYRRMWEETSIGLQSELLQTSQNGWKYFSPKRHGMLSYELEHLSCFTGGMFALAGVNHASFEPENNLLLGGDLTATCHENYDRTASKIGPETSNFYGRSEFVASGRNYILRPETVESYFVLWRTTHDPKYREWAWEAFEAIRKTCRTPNGYSGITDVTRERSSFDDNQQSFFLSETLKYLYLIFLPDEVLPLDQYVFNTEAHPLGIITTPIAQWDQALRDTLLLQ